MHSIRQWHPGRQFSNRAGASTGNPNRSIKQNLRTAGGGKHHRQKARGRRK